MENTLPTKTCVKCGKTKDLDFFYPHPGYVDGLNKYCKLCSGKPREYKQAEEKANSVILGSSGIIVHCPECGQEKDSDLFPPDHRSANGVSIRCYDCAYARHLASQGYKAKSLETYVKACVKSAARARLEKEQGEVCAICCKKTLNKDLALDHNHATGEIRALLCGNCNCMLGFAKEDITVLLAGIEYLKKYNKPLE